MGLLLLHLQCCHPLDTTMTVPVMSDHTNSLSPQPLQSIRDGGNQLAIPVANYEHVDSLKSIITSRAELSTCGLVEDVSCSFNFQALPAKGENYSKLLDADTESSLPDDADATMSVSSDTTLEAEPNDINYLKIQESKFSNLSLNVEENISTRSACLFDRETEASSYLPVMPSAVYTDDLKIDIMSNARFSKVLENISLPLLYIPTTRQLVTGGGDGTFEMSHSEQSGPVAKGVHTPQQNSPGNISECASSTLDLSSSELLNSYSPMHKAYSAQEFHKYNDCDRLTVHSTDSCPVFHNTLEPSSHLFADNSSLSSVSTGTDFSVSAISVSENDFNGESKSLSYEAADENIFVDINLHSRNSFDKGYNSSSLDSGYGDKKAPSFEATRKKSFTGFKNLFTKKTKDDSPPGWKLFGKVPPKPELLRQAQEVISEVQGQQQRAEKPLFLSNYQKHGSEVMSTTALILESRPTNLPVKKPEETQKHKQQYEEMIEAAKRKELKDIKLKKKQLQQQRRFEDQMMAAARAWDTEILPNWETMRSSKKTRDLWWMGLPPNVRGRVWQLAIGNELNITHALYNICHERAEDKIGFVQEETTVQGHTVLEGNICQQQEHSNKESSVRVIKLDVSRTFPNLCIFQKGGPFYDLLHNLLGAYACYRPDVGYVQGMSFIAAILLLNMDVADAFVCFANLLNRPCQLAFFRMDENLMTAYYRTFEEFFKECLPKLYAHFSCLGVTPNLYLMEWVFLLYSKSLPLDVACRVWDVFFRDGEEFLFRTALAILKINESVLLKMDFIHAAQFLTKLPEDVSAEQLFKEIDTVKMSIDKRGFHAIHSLFRDLQAINS